MTDMFEDAENNDKGNDDGSKSGASAFFRIFEYADTTSRILYSIALLGAIASGAALPMMTLLFGQSISSFSNLGGSPGSGGMDVDAAQRFRSDIDRFVLYFIYLFAARFVVGYVATLCVCVAAARTTNALRKAFLEGLLRREVADLDVADSGSAATQVTTNGNRVNQGIAEKLYAGVTGASLFFSSYIVALVVQWKLALITMSIIPAIILVVGGAFSADAPIENRITRIYSEAANTAQDALGSTKTITAFGAQKRIVSWYDDYLRRAHTEGMKKSLIFGVLFGGQTFITMAGTALAFWQGFRLFDSGEIASVGTVFTVTLSVTLGATSVVSMLPQFQAFSSASSAAAELFSVMDKPSALDPMSDTGEKPAADACEGEIVFRDVHFMYPARPGTSVLQGLNLSIPRGKTTALVGPSGCGKSTVVGLLQRWYEPSQGQVLLDGRDISQLNKTWLRTRMRVVQQESTFFQATVFENVSTGLAGEQRDLPQAEQRKLVVEACKSANAHAFIEQLPQGYDTHLGDGARILSGGQRQRLAVARSIISSPQILLCDEATSALDVHAETVVQKALNQVSKDKTMLIIAHKLATVMAADNIAVMASGRVVEQGNHQQLVEQDGLYAAMVRAQDLGGQDRGEVGRNAHNDEHSIAHDSTIAFSNDNLNKSTTTERSRPHQQDDEKRLATQTTSGPYLDAETANVSLPKAVFIMLREAPDLYKWYCVIAFAYICTGATYPAQALIFSRLIGVFSLQGAEATQQANFYALMFFIVALASLVGFFFIGIATNVIGQALTYRYRREMLERMLDMDQQFFDVPSNSSAALVSKLSSVPNALQELMSANVGLMASVLINVLATSVTGIAVGWKLGLVLVVVGLLAISGSGYLRIRLDQKLEAAAERQFISSAALAVEAVGSIRTVSSLTLEREVLARYSSSLDSILAKATRSLMTTLIPYSLSQSAEFLVLALGFWYGSRLVASGEYTTTQFFVVFIAVVFGEQATAQFFTWTTSINKGKVAANYLLWLRSIQPEIRETDENRNKGLPTLRGGRSERAEIEFRSVAMQYSNARRRNDSSSGCRVDNAKVLHDLSFSIKPGSYVAFVGASGCGKSTIMSLVQRFYDPTSGTVVMNGTDISTVSPARYRQQISLVQQKPPLYMGSVRDNILLGMAGDDRENQASEDDIREACRQADAWDFISSLPEGLNTSCGTRGAPRFSGGQRQRIALARALISQPRVLLLDEATSALDTQSEQVVQQALDAAAATRTTIAVAHRLSTIRRADVIFVVDRGRIVESGTHAELVRARGRYHAMCLAQSLDVVV